MIITGPIVVEGKLFLLLLFLCCSCSKRKSDEVDGVSKKQKKEEEEEKQKLDEQLKVCLFIYSFGTDVRLQSYTSHRLHLHDVLMCTHRSRVS